MVHNFSWQFGTGSALIVMQLPVETLLATSLRA
jgi:hypothetical protein